MKVKISKAKLASKINKIIGKIINSLIVNFKFWKVFYYEKRLIRKFNSSPYFFEIS